MDGSPKPVNGSPKRWTVPDNVLPLPLGAGRGEGPLTGRRPVGRLQTPDTKPHEAVTVLLLADDFSASSAVTDAVNDCKNSMIAPATRKTSAKLYVAQ